MNSLSSDKEEKPKGIQVICPGLGRTGTLSLTQALEILGHKPYHFVDFRHAAQWADFCRNQKDGKATADDLMDLIVNDGYTAILENPTCDIYQEFLRRFPDAKVVLTVRDSPEKFESSWKILFETMSVTEQDFSLTFPSFFQWIPLFRHLREIRPFMGTTHLTLGRGELTHGWRNKPDGWLAKQYTRHNEHIQQHVPSKQLLVFNVKEGWKPLCDFLGCDIPDVPFPHSKQNDTKALKQLKREFEIAVYAWIPVAVAITGSVAFYMTKSRQSIH